MASNYLWRLKAAGDGLYYTVWTDSDQEPTLINFNGTHAVVPDSGRIIISYRRDSPRLDNEDGRLMVAPVIHPDYYTPYFTSTADDFANGVHGGGTNFSVQLTYDGTTTVHTLVGQFVDHMHIIGGKLLVSNANIDDKFNVFIDADATPVTFNGSNIGNCNLVDLGIGGGASLIVPAAGDGEYDINLTEPANANLAGPKPVFVSKAVPVPVLDLDGNAGIGFWEWDEHTGELLPAPLQDGHYNLYNFPVTLNKYLNDLCITTGIPNTSFSTDFTLFHRSGPILPHWKFRMVYTTASSHTVGDKVTYNAQLLLARRSST